MNRNTIATAVLAIIQMGYLLTLWLSSQWLPQNVASHFNAAGIPDGWMPRAAYLWTMAGLAVGVAALLVGIFYSIRFFPNSTINLPRRDYWLAPERRAVTCAFLFRAGVWMASLTVALFWALQLFVVEAHASQPVKLSPYIWLLLGGFLLATMLWPLSLIRYFRRVA